MMYFVQNNAFCSFVIFVLSVNTSSTAGNAQMLAAFMV